MTFLETNDSPNPLITGIGVVAPNGIGITDFWTSLLRARSALMWLEIDKSSIPGQCIGAPVRDACFHSLYNDLAVTLNRQSRLGLIAASLALRDANISPHHIKQLELVPVYTSGISETFRSSAARYEPPQPDETPGRDIREVLSNFLSANMVPIRAVGSYTSGLELTAIAARAILDRFAPLAIVIASYSDLAADLCHAAMRYRNMISKFANPAGASRPFDRDRFGSLPAEAAAAIVVEDMRYARARGAQGYVEIAGFAWATDQPGKEPMSELCTAITMALANAREMPSAVGYVCAYAPSDPVLDRTETQAIKAALGTSAYRTPISSIKGVTGDPKWAGGLLQLASTALAARNGIIPPTANYEHADPLCDLDYTPSARRVDFRTALIHAYTASGQNHVLVVRNRL